MKTVKLLIVFFFLSFLSSCVDTEEYIIIHADNSGVYTMVLDMSKIIGLAGQMGGEEMNGEQKQDKLDTTMYLKDQVLAADNLSEEEKKLYTNASISIKLDKTNEEMKLTLTCPFSGISQLPELKNNFYTVLNKLKALDKLAGKESGSAGSNMEGEGSEKAFTPGSAYYNFRAVPGRIEYSITDTLGFRKMLSSDSTMIMMQQMMAVMGEMTYKTSITTANEIKNYQGSGATLSADKKTVMFSSTFSEMVDHPGKLSYKVDY